MAEKLSITIFLDGAAEIERQLEGIGQAGTKAFEEIGKAAEGAGGFDKLDPKAVQAKLEQFGVKGKAAIEKITAAVAQAGRLERIVGGVRQVEAGFASIGVAAGAMSQRITTAFNAVGTAAASAVGAIAPLRRTLRLIGIGGGALSLAGIGAAIVGMENAGDAARVLEGNLQALFRNQQQGTAFFLAIQNAARNAGADLNQTGQTMVAILKILQQGLAAKGFRFAPGEGFKETAADAAILFDTLLKGMKLTGIRAEDAEKAIKELFTEINKNQAVRGDTFTQVSQKAQRMGAVLRELAARFPQLANELVKFLGTPGQTMEELADQVERGIRKIDIPKFINAVKRITPEITKLHDAFDPTLAQRMDTIGGAWSRLLDSFGESPAGAAVRGFLDDIAKGLDDVAKKQEQVGKFTVDKPLTGFGQFLDNVRKTIETTKQEWLALVRVWESAVALFNTIDRQLRTLGETIRGIFGASPGEQLFNAFRILLRSLGPVGFALERIYALMKALGLISKETAAEVDASGKKSVSAWDELLASMTAGVPKMEELRQKTEETAKGAEKLGRIRINPFFKPGEPAVEPAGKGGLDSLIDGFDKFEKEMKGGQPVIKEYKEELKDLRKEFETFPPPPKLLPDDLQQQQRREDQLDRPLPIPPELFPGKASLDTLVQEASAAFSKISADGVAAFTQVGTAATTMATQAGPSILQLGTATELLVPAATSVSGAFSQVSSAASTMAATVGQAVSSASQIGSTFQTAGQQASAAMQQLSRGASGAEGEVEDVAEEGQGVGAISGFATQAASSFDTLAASAQRAAEAIAAAAQAGNGPFMGMRAGGLFGGFQSGGLLGGRGTGTSDSNLVRLSRGEYIVPARAVKQPGVLAFLEALRRSGGSLRDVLDDMGRFALGGLVPRAIPSFASGGLAGGGMSNVTIQFPGMPEITGLRAPAKVVEELRKTAAMAQVRSGGRKPSRYT